MNNKKLEYMKYLEHSGIAKRHGKGYSFEEFCKIIRSISLLVRQPLLPI